jgi:hypothetical protein
VRLRHRRRPAVPVPARLPAVRVVRRVRPVVTAVYVFVGYWLFVWPFAIALGKLLKRNRHRYPLA